jgi:hypothetical protein
MHIFKDALFAQHIYIDWNIVDGAFNQAHNTFEITFKICMKIGCLQSKSNSCENGDDCFCERPGVLYLRTHTGRSNGCNHDPIVVILLKAMKL